MVLEGSNLILLPDITLIQAGKHYKVSLFIFIYLLRKGYYTNTQM